MSKGRTIRNKKLQEGDLPQRGVLPQKGGSIINEFMNAKGLINDMVSNAYTSYKGVDPFPSSSVYRDQFLRAV
jgi:hypothetical protein